MQKSNEHLPAGSTENVNEGTPYPTVLILLIKQSDKQAAEQ